MEKYIDRLVETRNEIVHVEPWDAPTLKGNERTRAFYELIIVIHATFLELAGMEEDIFMNYATDRFNRVHKFNLTY